MAIFNLRRKEIQAKIVYYGPGLSGKTTNLQFVHTKLKPENKGELMTLATQTDRTLFFDFLPIELGQVRGLKTRFQLYTVPGQVFYNSTRKLVLKNADGVVFVADSRAEALNDNLESLRNLEQNLETHKLDIHSIPLVIQYNKRDLPGAMSVEELNKHLNTYGAPTFEAEAHRGRGVLDTLSHICKAVIRDLKDKDPDHFRNPDDTGIDTRIAPPQEPAKAATQAIPVKAEVQSGSGSPDASWRLATSNRKPRLDDGLIHVPLALTNGTDTVHLTLKLWLDQPDS